MSVVRWPYRSILLLVAGSALALAVSAAAAQTDPASHPATIRGAQLSAPVTPFVFDGDVRDLPAVERWRPGDPVKEIPRRFYPEPGTMIAPDYEPGVDPLLQRQLDWSAQIVTGFTGPDRNFPGQGYSGANPPDTVGDVGPSHYIQMVNGTGGATVVIYDKSKPTAVELASFALDSLGGGACASGYGDPIVLYDRLADRWLLSEFSSSGNNFCVYISQTGDPVSGGWYAYGFAAPSFPDYPKYGVWATDANGGLGSYIVTANDGGPGIYALDRGAMLSGSAGTYQRMSIPSLPGFGFESPTPADADGPLGPPALAPAIIMRHRDTENHGGPVAPGDLLEMWTFDVDWTTPANTTLTTEPSIDVAEFDSDLCGLTSFYCFPQPESTTRLDPLREVIMNRLQYVHHDDRETLVGNYVVDVDGTDHGGVRWFELERTGAAWTLKQEGTYSIDADHRWMASSAMDQSGNIALAYNISSTSTYPGLRYTGRLVDDPPGVMTQPETVIHDGASPNSSNRYGDYAAMNLDPADDCTFWFTGMDNLTTNWRTQIASFKFDACGCQLYPDPPNAGAVDNGDNRIDVGWDDSSLETVTEYLVRRSRTSGGPYQTIATVPDSSPGFAGGPGYTFQDLGVSGGITYYYVVVASDGLACKSAPLNEVNATGTGPCTLPPLFDGLKSVTPPFEEVCTLKLTWDAASAECGGGLTYDVFRSTTAGFEPGPANLLAGGVGGTTYTDLDALVDGQTYHYVVRAIDTSNGVVDANVVERSGRPGGVLVTGTWFDDAGDTEPAKMITEAPWSIDGAEGFSGPNVYKTGDYGNNTCAGLLTPSLRLGTGSTLTFYSHYEIESSWDKGEVQISTDGGSTWERVSVDYPGSSTNTSDSCGLPTGTYFTGFGAAWTLYSADLSTWADQEVLIRFLISSDSSITDPGWWVDDITITQVDVPGECSTSTGCQNNPLVDVQPDGPMTTCVGTPLFAASTVGGVGPFAYQWTRDGVDIPGATDSYFVPRQAGTYTYDCRVAAEGCSQSVSDPQPTEITQVDFAFFDGVQSVVDEQASDCSVALGWSPATTVCDGPVSYYIFRDTAPDVALAPENLVASGLTGSNYVDRGELSDGVTYYYRVQALERSTGMFDGNVSELSAAPSGPGTGLNTLFAEDFEDPASVALWSASVSPASRTCGLWTVSTAPGSRPTGGSGSYAVSDGSPCGSSPTSTTYESPPIDVSTSGVVEVTLDLDLFYSYLGGGDDASIQVWDGASWNTIWSDANADFDGHLSIDVTAWAAGNPDFRVRLDYQDIDQWLAVDNVVVVADIVNLCATTSGPSPAPSGEAGTAPLLGGRLTPAGDRISLGWDTNSCAASDYNLLYGDLAAVSSYTLSGSECALGRSGSFEWSNVPPGDLFFLVVGTDGDGTESSWGRDALYGERNGETASGQCSVVAKDVSGTCP
jgi:hypothetical protein